MQELHSSYAKDSRHQEISPRLKEELEGTVTFAKDTRQSKIFWMINYTVIISVCSFSTLVATRSELGFRLVLQRVGLRLVIIRYDDHN